MKDLKHLYDFERLLEDAHNDLIRQAQGEGRICVGYTCENVPEPLLNGNHAHIMDWQLSESLYITLRRRPELASAYLDGRKFTRHQQKVVDAVFARIREEDSQQAAVPDGQLPREEDGACT